jgi:hypothetical protein
VRNKLAQDTSVSITRGARTVKGRLPGVDQGVDSVLQWKLSTEAMKQAMLTGTFQPFKADLEGPDCMWQQLTTFRDRGFRLAV